MMVHPDSHKIPRVPWYSGILLELHQDFAYGAITLFGRPFQTIPLSIKSPTLRAPQPRKELLPAGLGHSPISLVATPGVSIDFHSSGY